LIAEAVAKLKPYRQA